jgi:hypothetical protein
VKLFLYTVCAAVTLLLLGCKPVQDPLDTKTISSFEEVEEEINRIEKTVRERNARERLYQHFYDNRDEVLKIANGGYHSEKPLHRALVREMSWVVLAELKEKRYDFEMRVVRERNDPSIQEPSVEKSGEEIELEEGL